MSRFEIILSVDADHQADARDLADQILKDVRVAILKGAHPGIEFDNHITVAQRLPVRTFLPEGPSAA